MEKVGEMTINEYNRYGRVRNYVLCEDPGADNTPKLNRKGFAFAVDTFLCDKCEEDGFYPCSTLYFKLPNIKEEKADTGGLGRGVSFNLKSSVEPRLRWFSAA